MREKKKEERGEANNIPFPWEEREIRKKEEGKGEEREKGSRCAAG